MSFSWASMSTKGGMSRGFASWTASPAGGLVGGNGILARGSQFLTTATHKRETYQRHIQADISRRLKRQRGGNMDLDQRGWLWYAVDSSVFKGFILFLVLANVVTMGVEADHPNWPGWWHLEQIFVGAFVLEALMKGFALRGGYFADSYNLFDCLLAILGMLDIWIFGLLGVEGASLRTLSVLRVLRLFRLIRVLRLVRGSDHIRMVIQGVADAVKCTFWVGLVMLLGIYVGSIFCMAFFGGEKGSHFPGFSTQWEDIERLEFMTEFNPHIYFGSMANTFLTLFSVAFLATWTDVVFPVFLIEPLFIVFFFLFFLFMFGLLNVIIGLIVDKVLHNAKRLEEERKMMEQTRRLALLEKIKNLVSKVDQDGNGIVSVEELQEHIICQSAEFHDVMRDSDLQLPIGCTAEELMAMMTTDGEEELHVDKFIQSFFRLTDSTDFQRVCMLQMGINAAKHSIQKTHLALESRMSQLEARLFGKTNLHKMRTCDRITEVPRESTTAHTHHEIPLSKQSTFDEIHKESSATGTSVMVEEAVHEARQRLMSEQEMLREEAQCLLTLRGSLSMLPLATTAGEATPAASYSATLLLGGPPNQMPSPANTVERLRSGASLASSLATLERLRLSSETANGTKQAAASNSKRSL